MVKRNKIVFYTILPMIIIIITTIAFEAFLNSQTPKEPQESGLYPLPVSAKILFVSNMDTGSRAKEIYSMNENGSDITRITYSNYHHKIVGIDKTKRYVVATRVENDTNPPARLGDEDRKSLWILDLETGSEKRLTDPNNNAEGDSFSPDGEWIVFHTVVAGDTQADIYKIKRDGANLTRLTKTNDATESDSAWSSDGQKIAFVSYSAQIQRFGLKILDINGDNVRTVYDPNDAISTPYFKQGVYDPSWSPDDQWIVFEKPVDYAGENGDAGIWHIFKIHPNGTGLIGLSENGGHTDMAEYFPSFSGDGECIIFSARYGSSDPASVQVDIFVMDEEGGSVRKLTDMSSGEDFEVWVR